MTLWHLPISEARRLRHEAGVKRYRNGDSAAPFDGDPGAELYPELLDALNYRAEWGGHCLIAALIWAATWLTRRALRGREAR